MGNEPQIPENKLTGSVITPEDARQLKITRYLLISSLVLCALSIILGPYSSTGALICSIIGLVKFFKLDKKGGAVSTMAQKIQVLAIVSVCVSVIAFTLSIAILIFVYPIALEMFQQASGGSATGSKTWG